MKANFSQILHQSIAPANNAPPPGLSNSDQLPKISFLKKKIQVIYKSRSKAIKITAPPTGSVLKKRSDPNRRPGQPLKPGLKPACAGREVPKPGLKSENTQWTKAADLQAGKEIAVADLLFENKVHQQNNQQQQSVQNRGSIQKSIDIENHFPSSANFMANNNDSIPHGKLPVNSLTASLTDLTAPNQGEAKIIPNQTADKLINKSDTTFNRIFTNTFIDSNISQQWVKVISPSGSVLDGSQGPTLTGGIEDDGLTTERSEGSDLIGFLKEVPKTLSLKPGLKEVPKPGLKSADTQWTKAADLQAGKAIAVAEDSPLALRSDMKISYQSHRNYQQQQQQTSPIQNFVNADIIDHNPFTSLILFANNNATIPINKFIVKKTASIPESTGNIDGNITTAPIQPADKLINQSANVSNQTSDNFINNHSNTITPGVKEVPKTLSLKPGLKEVPKPGLKSADTQWTKAADLQAGKEIAVAEDLLFESNPAGNISQQQSDHRHTERDLGQNNSISQINHNFSNNFAVFTASNQLNITKMALAVNNKEVHTPGVEFVRSIGILSLNNSYSGFSQNRECPLETGGSLNNGKKSSEEFKHDCLSRPEFKHLFFTQDAGGITQGYLDISSSNTGILGGHITKSVTALQQMQDIGNGNSGAFDAGLAKSNSLFDDNTRGRSDFDNLVHSNNYNNFAQNLSNSRWLGEQTYGI